MVEKDYGHVVATFSKKDIKPFQELINRVCSEDDFYRSDTVEYIKGDVSSDLHLTIFYGLIDRKMDHKKLRIHINSINLKKLKLRELFLRPIPSSLYQILWLVVADDDHELQATSESFERYEYDEFVQLGFVPHLTLAYVSTKFRLKNTMYKYPNEIRIGKIKYFER